MSAIAYALAEALVSLRRSGRSVAMSMGTIAIAFLALGGFLLLTANLRGAIDRWTAAAEVSVFLDPDLTAEQRDALVAELTRHPAVARIEYVSRDAALERFSREFTPLADVASSLENPFPASIEARLHPAAEFAGAAEQLAAQMITRPGVSDVRFDQQWLSRLMAVVTATRLAGLAVAAVLMLGAAFTVNAVVRLSLQARREEIDIMELVGAPLAFIRGPAIAEGVLLGGIGAVLSLFPLWAIFVAARERLFALAKTWGNLGEPVFLSPFEAVALILVGAGIGALAGGLAARAAR